MTIRRRFVILLAMFGLAVLVSLASAWSSFAIIEREVSRPAQNMASVLTSLRTIKRGAEAQATMLLGEPSWGDTAPESEGHGVRGERSGEAPEFDADAFGARTNQMKSQLDVLQHAERWRIRAKDQTVILREQNLRDRIEGSHTDAMKWGESRDDVARRRAGLALFEIHELIEKIEGRVLDDTHWAEAFETQLRARLIGVLGLVAVLTGLVGLLSLSLVGRWVVRPIERLRVAAERIGAGEFSYRLHPRGKDELSTLAREVNLMAGLVEKSQEERIERERLVAVGQMMRRLVHNIRNPLSGIRGLAEMTHQEVEDQDLKDSQRRIIDAVDRFEEWLNRLLRATSPADLDCREVSVESWLQGVIQAHEPMAASRGVAIECDLGGARAMSTRVFDPDHMGHALAAILANAIEATAKGGVVRIHPSAADGSWKVSVTDEGAGISDEVLPNLFRPSFSTKKQGTGIGLASALHAVRGHGGRIEVESLDSSSDGGSGEAHGTGARFSLVLPDQVQTASLANNGQSGADSGQDSHY